MYTHTEPMQAILCNDSIVTVELMDDEGAIVRRQDGGVLWADLSWLTVLVPQEEAAEK